MESLCKAMYLSTYRGIKNWLAIIAIMLISPFCLVFQVANIGTRKLHAQKTIIIVLWLSILMIGLCIYTLIQLG